LDDVRREVGPLTDQQIADNAGIVIDKILHNYTQFSISTIDAFFQKIVKSFAKELGLLGNFKVELDQEKIMKEIIDQIMDDLGKEKELTGWLVDFSFSKVDDNKAWNIRPEIESLAKEVFKESFRNVEEALEGTGKAEFDFLLGQLKKTKKEFESVMISGATEALKLMEAHGLEIGDFAYNYGGPAGFFYRIKTRQEYDPKARARQALEDPEKWSTKTSPKKDQIRKVVDAGLHKITQSLVDHYDQHKAEYITALEIHRNLYVFGILKRITDKLRVYRQEHDVMLISDVAVFLNRIIADNDAPFIYEKTGSWYRHYLIDEFQDTSGYQWQNFRPLVENGLSQNYKSLLVGDGKQSIYRWRGGDWNLILQQVSIDLANYTPSEKRLDTNWRSDRKIVEFNNEVFSWLSRFINDGFSMEIEALSLPAGDKEVLLAMAGDVEKLYADVAQQVTAKNLTPSSGRIEINAYQKAEDTSWKDNVLLELPKTIEQLQDGGFEARDIAVLVRKSDDGKQVIERLMRYKHSPESEPKYCYDAISNESLFLGNSSAIRLLINTIKYGLDPEDAIARAEISFNYHQLSVESFNASHIHDLGFIQQSGLLPDDFEPSIQTFISLPVFEMIERIIQYYGLNDVRYKGYLQAFQDVVMEYFGSEVKDLNDFLEWWEEKGRRQSVQLPESMNAIRVMTIHKSKGLEFKALIIPFCDWKLDLEATKNNIIWCTTDKQPFDKSGILPLKYSKSLADSFFARDYYLEKIRAYIDNLNLLYVALTRAEKYLILNCPPPGKEPANVGDLMLKAIEHISSQASDKLPVHVNTDNDFVTRYHIGEPGVVLKSPATQAVHQVILPYQSADWSQKIAIRRRGVNFFESETPEWKTKINYGMLMHEILATIRSEQEAASLIDRYHQEGIISEEEKHMLSEQLNQIFLNDQVRSWFNTNAEIKTEATVLSGSDGERRPDRVLIEGKSAVVIDFKTGAEKPSDNRQVKEYQVLLKEMGYEKVEAYLLYIAQNKVVKVA
jgi:ATP-dependent exoDNAse (exonuclease V) beta subunit